MMMMMIVMVMMILMMYSQYHESLTRWQKQAPVSSVRMKRQSSCGHAPAGV